MSKVNGSKHSPNLVNKNYPSHTIEIYHICEGFSHFDVMVMFCTLMKNMIIGYY
jgi:hypothetical protein